MRYEGVPATLDIFSLHRPAPELFGLSVSDSLVNAMGRVRNRLGGCPRLQRAQDSASTIILSPLAKLIRRDLAGFRRTP